MPENILPPRTKAEEEMLSQLLDLDYLRAQMSQPRTGRSGGGDPARTKKRPKTAKQKHRRK